MKVTQVISWEGDRPVWIADGGLLSSAEKLEVLNFVANPVLDNECVPVAVHATDTVGKPEEIKLI